MPKTGRIYVRRSNQTDRAADISTQRQVENGKARLTARGVSVFAIYQEAPGIRSGTDDKYRPEYRRMLADAQPGDILWSNDQARFSRADELPTVVKNLRKRNIEVMFDDHLVDVDSATGMLMLRFATLMHAQYSTDVSESQRKSYRQFRESGAYTTRCRVNGIKAIGHGIYRRAVASKEGIWRVPIGMVVGERDAPPFCAGVSAQFYGYLDTVRLYFEWLAREGLGVNTAVDRLNALGYVVHGRDGMPHAVNKSNLRKFRDNMDRYSGVLDHALLTRVRQRIGERRGKWSGRAHTRHGVPLLFRLITCGICGHRWGTQYNRSGNLLYDHSHHPCARKHKYYVATKIQPQLWAYLERALQLPDDAVREAAHAAFLAQETHASAPDYALKRAELERQLANLRKMLAQERITEAEYDHDRAELLAELAALPRELPAQQEMLSEQEIYETVRDMLGTLRDAAAVDTVLVNDVLDQMFAAIVLEDSGELRFMPREAWRPFLGGSTY